MFYTKTLDGATNPAEGEAWTVSNWAEISVSNQATSEVVNKVTFDITKDGKTYNVELQNGDYADFFKTTSKWETLRVSKVD
jgi:hypothetical protein